MTRLSDYGISPETTAAANFGAEEELTGFGGCNSYNTAYSVKGDEITINPPASTRTACVDSAM